ncbi:MAG: response regulator [Planctomycetota bacterium]
MINDELYKYSLFIETIYWYNQRMQNENAQRPNVLVIEDDPGYQRILELYFQRAGAVCDCCFDGRGGLQKALSNTYDIIIIDIHIPEMDGFAVATQLRDENDMTPLIAITAITIEGLRKNALKVGFNEFLQKPLTEESIARILQEYASGKETETA